MKHPMKRSSVVLAVWFALPIGGQVMTFTTDPILKFEVASIRPSDSGQGAISGINTRNGRVDARNVTVTRCIMGAYEVGPHEIVGGPNWIATDRYEIRAKAPQPINNDHVLMLMLRGLLADRFRLVLHHEKRLMRAFVLSMGKAPSKLERGDGGESRTNTSTNATAVMLDARNTSMDEFARILARKMDRPVVNETSLEGVFNLKLRWTPERTGAADAAASDEPSIFTAIIEQLGLSLHAEKTTVDMLVVDQLERPSDN